MMRDMTKGAPLGHLFLYAVPLLLGNWLQLAYNAVDSIIAGRFIGQDALAAEGVAGPVMNLVILAISGLCIGAGVLMSEAFGAKRTDRLQETLATTLLFGAVLCCGAAALGCVATPWILRALAVPDAIFGITAIYLRITFLGAPFTFFYNALAAGLKSVGDSKTPLKFFAFSAVLNAVLDLILIGGLGFGIVCSAVTTVAAEAASAVLAAVYMARRVPELCPGRGQWRIRRDLLGPILRYGSVTALQQAVQPICKVLIQGQVNALGVGAEHRDGHYDLHCPEPGRTAERAHPPRFCRGPAAGTGLLAAGGLRDAGIPRADPLTVCGGGGGRRRGGPGQRVPGVYGGVLCSARADERFPGILPRHGQDDDDADRNLYAGGSARCRSRCAGPACGAAGHRLCLRLRLVRHAGV